MAGSVGVTDLSQAPADSNSLADPSAADWRVLLPAPTGGTFASLLLLGGSPALAKLLVAIELARQVIVEVPCEPRADAVVLLAGAGVSPADVVGCMRGDAVLFWEVDQRADPWLQRRPDRIGKLLRDSGFAAIALYGVRPDFQNCNSYLPLEARGALGWYFHEKRRRQTLLRRFFARSPLRISAFRRGYVPNCYAAVAGRGGIDKDAVSRGILGQLPARVLRSATRLLVVKRRGRKGRDRRLIVLAFSSSDPLPVGVLKISRTPEQRSRIDAEQSALVSIRGLLDDEMRTSLPEPHGCFEVGTSLVGVESYLAGRRRARALRERRRQFDLAVSWIARFHRQVKVARRPWGPADIDKWIAKPIAEYRQEFGMGDSESRLFEALLTLSRNLCGESLPLVWCHGDFNESNIFYTDESLRVLDWEAAAIGLPLFDLLYFATSWSYRTERLKEQGDHVRRFREIIVERRPGDQISRAVWRAIDDYMARLGIDRRFVALLIALNSLRSGPADEVLCLAEGCDRLFCESGA